MRIEDLGAEISANEEENDQLENEIEELEDKLRQLKGQ
jgi:peptidoglycan hydrolase CwlO-like protein